MFVSLFEIPNHYFQLHRTQNRCRNSPYTSHTWQFPPYLLCSSLPQSHKTSNRNTWTTEWWPLGQLQDHSTALTRAHSARTVAHIRGRLPLRPTALWGSSHPVVLLSLSILYPMWFGAALKAHDAQSPTQDGCRACAQQLVMGRRSVPPLFQRVLWSVRKIKPLALSLHFW